MAAGTKPILCSTPWIPPCSLWSTSTTFRRLHPAHTTTWKSVPYASCEGCSSVKSSEHGAVDHHPHATWRSERSPPKSMAKIIQASTSLPPNRSCFTLPNSHWTADTEGGSTAELRGGGQRRAEEEEQGSSCTKSFFKLFKKDLHIYMYVRLEKKRLYATQSLEEHC